MKSFKYKAVSSNGLKVSGKVKANNMTSAMSKIQFMGLQPLSVTRTFGFLSLFDQKINHFDLYIVFDFLAKLLKNGISLDKALDMVGESDVKGNIVFANVKNLILEGHSFGEALSENMKDIGKSGHSMLKIIDKVGCLGDFLEFLSEYYKKIHVLHSQIRKSMRYPIMLLIFFLISFSVIVNFLIPSIVQLVEQINHNSVPYILKCMNNISLYFKFYVSGIAVLFVSAYIYSKKVYDLFDLIPSVRKYRFYRDFTFFFYTSYMLLANKFALIESFEIAKESMNYERHIHKIEKVCKNIESGFSISDSFKNQKLDNFLVKMVGLYEKSSNMKNGFVAISEMLETKMFRYLENVAEYMQPLAICLLGSLIVVTLYSILIPLYSSFSA